MGIYSTYIPGAGAKFFEFQGKFHFECHQTICPSDVSQFSHKTNKIYWNGIISDKEVFHIQSFFI